MQHKTILFSALFGLASLFGGLAFYQARRADAEQNSPAKGKGAPVIVELFTSEGCSSCPSADRLLAMMATRQSIPGAQIIALSEHVDYWNRLGWADPFSSPAFSERQGAYARSFHLDSVYTPQMIVNGQMEFVGSDGEQAREAIASAARSPRLPVTVVRGEGRPEMKPNTLPLQVRVDAASDLRGAEGADVYLAITENNLRSEVRRGENSGRTLEHIAVVRQLNTIGSVSSRDGFNARPTITLSPNWKRKDLNAVVFVQDRRNHHILGANILSLNE